MKIKSLNKYKIFIVVFSGIVFTCTIILARKYNNSKSMWNEANRLIKASNSNATNKSGIALRHERALLSTDGPEYLGKDEKNIWDNYSNNSIGKNAFKYLVTPTPDKTGQANHPDMVYFSKGFNGYKYWMACTPYAFSNEKIENPEVLVSNDGLNFKFPNSNNNSVVPPPDDFKLGGHFSDTDLMYNQGKFILHFVYNKRGVLGPSRFYRITSTDGIHWSKPELVFKSVDTKEGYSPGFVIDNNVTNIWYIGGQGNFVYTKSSDDEKIWDKVKKCNINMGAWKPWHVDIIKTDNGYEGLMCARYIKINTRALFYIKSSDGINWESSTNPILFPTKKGWDNIEIYRSTMIKENGTYRIWYSARGKGQRWHIGYTEIKQSQLNNISMS